MKKINNYLLISILLAFAAISCEDAPSLTQSPSDYLSFESVETTVPVTLNGTGSLDLKVYSTIVGGNSRSYNITVDDASTASAASYTVPTSVEIPAGSNTGVISMSFVDTAISNSGETLVLNLVPTDETSVGESITVNLVRDCPSDLAGVYNVVSSGTSTDGAPANNPLVDLAYEVTVTQTGPTTYTISDGFAGVYQDWYCAPYGYCFETEGNFTDTCGSLAGEWVEGFNSEVVLTGTDNFDGTLSISWSNGFGDQATAVYTKQ